MQSFRCESSSAITAKAITKDRLPTTFPSTGASPPIVSYTSAVSKLPATTSLAVLEPMKLPTLRLPGLSSGPGVFLTPVVPSLVSPSAKASYQDFRFNSALPFHGAPVPDDKDPPDDNGDSDDPFVSALSTKPKIKKKIHTHYSSGSSSTDDTNRRNRRSVKPLKLADPPVAGALRPWMSDFYVRLCAASKRSQRRTLAWGKQILLATSPGSLAKPNSRWEDLDSALSLAVLEMARGPAKRDILMYQEVNFRKGEPLGGRSAMFIVLQRYHIDSGTQMQVDLTSIMSLKFDTDFEVLLSRLDYVLMEANTSIPEEFLYASIEPELRKCRDLAADFVALDATDDGHPSRTSSALYNVARRCLVRKQRMTMREALTSKTDNKKALVVAKAKKGDTKGKDGKGKGREGKSNTPCSNFIAGNCRYGDNCIFSHSSTSSPPAKAKAVATPETKKTPCRFWQQKGECRFGDAYIFKHGDGAVPGKGKGGAQAKAKPKGPPAPAKHKDGSPVICEQWKTAGSCTYGDSCKFLHEGHGAPAPKTLCLAALAAKRTSGLTERYTLDTGTGRDIAGE